MLKKIAFFAVLMIFSVGIVGCESEAEKQATLEKQKKEEIQKKMMESAYKPSEKKSW